MNIITLKEQQEHYYFSKEENKLALSFIEDGGKLDFAVEETKQCLQLTRVGDKIKADVSHYVGIDWISEHSLAVQVYPKMNDGFEIDYVRMLNEALEEEENFKHLQGIVTIDFNKPSIPIEQKQDMLSVFLSLFTGQEIIYQHPSENCEKRLEEKLLFDGGKLEKQS